MVDIDKEQLKQQLASYESRQSEQINQARKYPKPISRLIHLILDWLIINYVWVYIVAIPLGIFLLLLGLNSDVIDEDPIVQRITGVILYFSYYLLFEGIFGKSPAKFITKTVVVSSNGSKPSFVSILLRTLCRFVPFDQISLLIGKNDRCWHDAWSKTEVVMASSVHSNQVNTSDGENIEATIASN